MFQISLKINTIICLSTQRETQNNNDLLGEFEELSKLHKVGPQGRLSGTCVHSECDRIPEVKANVYGLHKGKNKVY